MMKKDRQRKDGFPLNSHPKEGRKEKIALVRERLRNGFYSSEDIVSFLAEKMAMEIR